MPLGIESSYAEYRYAECRDYLNVILSVIMLNVIILSVVTLNVIMLRVVGPFQRVSMEQHVLKNVNSFLNTKYTFYFETSGGQNSTLYLNVVHFFDISVN